MNHAATKNSANFFADRPPWFRHFVGACGEVAFAKTYDLPVDEDTIGRGDDGTDFPGGIQVKTAFQKRPPRLMFPQRQWLRKHAQIYVLAWAPAELECSEISLIGWIRRQRAVELLRGPRDFGYGPTVWIEQADLGAMPPTRAERESC